MNRRTLILRNLIYFRRTHIGVVIGCALATAITVGALLVGDSVRGTMKNMVLSRLQKIHYAASLHDEFFAAGLASRLQNKADVPASAVLAIRATAANDTGTARVNTVMVYGVDASLDQLSTIPANFAALEEGQVAVNQKLAEQLQVKEGDEILLRMTKPGLLPGDAPMSVDADKGLALRVKVVQVLASEQMGNMSLQNASRIASNAFVERAWLAEKMELSNKANHLLVGESENPETLNRALQQVLNLEDVGFEFRDLDDIGVSELRTDRVFIKPQVTEKLAGSRVMTYFVNEIRLGDKATPYSFASSPGRPGQFPDLEGDNTFINQWLAEDLGAKVGDQISVRYFALAPGAGLQEDTVELTVSRILAMDEVASDKELMPKLPGLADADNCSEWDPGLPIDLNKIREKDETYWDNYRGTPKIYVSLTTAQKLWGNRFGNVTALRFPQAPKIQDELTAQISPEMFGLTLRPIRQQALEAGRSGVDFGPLFLGLSFFIIAAALLLAALMFVFGIEQRRNECGMLLSLGFKQKEVFRLLLWEGLLLAVLGSSLGAPFGILINRVVLTHLGGIWKGAVNALVIEEYTSVQSVLAGVVGCAIVALLSMWLTARKQVRGTIASIQRDLLKPPASIRRSGILMLITAVASVVLTLMNLNTRGQEASLAFMGIGALVLGSILCGANVILTRWNAQAGQSLVLSQISIRNNARRKSRSLATITLLGIGIFLVAAVTAMRQDPMKHAGSLNSGTGGYAFYGETAIPLHGDLNAASTRKKLLLDEEQFSQVHVEALRVRQGGDASCQNLNRVYEPTILGVDVDAFSQRGGFSFASTLEDTKHPWELLNHTFDDGAIPAIADQNVILWILKNKIGGTIDYRAEDGTMFKIRFIGGLKNSIFQGSILISSDHFLEKFPGASGFRRFLVDTSDVALGNALMETMQDQGLELTNTRARLAEFNRVESTYLHIFLVLGAFGLLLGSFGLAIVIFRNVLERRNELAVLRAYGFSLGLIRRMLLMEHLTLMFAGLIAGGISAGVALIPAVRSSGADVPFGQLGIFFLALVVLGVLWTVLASILATRGNLIDALRDE